MEARKSTNISISRISSTIPPEKDLWWGFKVFNGLHLRSLGIELQEPRTNRGCTQHTYNGRTVLEKLRMLTTVVGFKPEEEVEAK
jgi:hypothetical protein